MDPRARHIAVLLIVLALVAGGWALQAGSDDTTAASPTSSVAPSQAGVPAHTDDGASAAANEYDVVKLPPRARH
jgi:hypothetical protein